MSLWVVAYLVGSLMLDGYTGFHLARGGWHGTPWQTAVGLGSLGISGEVCAFGSVSLRFLYFDLLRGSRHTPGYSPYLQEAKATLRPGHGLALTLGHQLLSFREGFFLTDIGDGMDALRLSWAVPWRWKLDAFYVLQGSRAFGDRPTGDFAGAYLSHRVLDLYGALRTDGTGLAWLGLRGEGRRHRWHAVAEVAGLWQGRRVHPAGQVYVRYQAIPRTLGAGVYYLAPHWQKPVSYPQVMDNFYNGWTAFGEALNWVVLPLALAPVVSSAPVGDPYAVYWPDPHNLWVIHGMGSQQVGLLHLRADLFGFGLAQDPETGQKGVFLGPEATLTVTASCEGFTVGLTAGVFLGERERILGTRQAAWNLRIWSFVPFEVQLETAPF